jgi:ATPase
MTVKVPAGMTEEDLARPIVVVSDFETGAAEYELYSYGEETVVVPLSKIKGRQQPGHLKLAASSVKDYFKAYSHQIEVEMAESGRATVYVPEKSISAIIGKQGSNIQRIEKELGIRIDIKDMSERQPTENSSFEGATDYEISSTKSHLLLHFPKKYKNMQVDLHIEDDYVMSGQISKDGTLKITKKHKMGKLLETAAKQGTLRVRSP